MVAKLQPSLPKKFKRVSQLYSRWDMILYNCNNPGYGGWLQISKEIKQIRSIIKSQDKEKLDVDPQTGYGCSNYTRNGYFDFI